MCIRGSIRAICFYLAGILAFMSFWMVFLTPITIDGANLSFQEVYFGNGFFYSASGGFIGFILILLTGFAFIIRGIFLSLDIKVNMTLSHVLDIATIVLMTLGIILIFCTKPMFLAINELDTKINIFKLGIGPLTGGLMSLIGGVCASIGLIMPE